MIGIYFMALLYVAAGVTHFIIPHLYEHIVPPFIPWPRAAVIWSGIAEIILGLALLFTVTRAAAATGIIILLILVFPANIYQLMDPKARLGLPVWVLILRVPMQLILIYWAYLYT